MIPSRFDLFPIAVLLFLGVSLATVMTAVWPRRFGTRRGHWIRNGLIVGFLLAYLGLEMAQRSFGAPGGGPLRMPVSVVRSAIAVCWASALLLIPLKGTLAVLSRLFPAYFQKKVGKEILVTLAPSAANDPQVLSDLSAAAAAPTVQKVEEPQMSGVVSPPSSDVPAESQQTSSTLSRRQAIERGIAVSTVSTLSTVVGYGLLKGSKDLRVREIVVPIASLPRALEGYTIAQLTDIHVGIFTGERDFAAVIEKANALRADAMVLTGDLLDRNPKFVPDAMRLFARLRARDGVYAILGNHDYYTGYRAVLAGLNATPIRTLINEHLVLRPNDGGIILAGIDEMWAPRLVPGRGPDLRRALLGADPELPKVLLAHNPKLFETSRGSVDLQLSGHTHGGQVNFSPLMERLLTYVSGVYQSEHSRLFVSNGLGFTGLPFRLNAPPEIVKIVLVNRL